MSLSLQQGRPLAVTWVLALAIFLIALITCINEFTPDQLYKMPAIQPNKNFDNEGPEIRYGQGYIRTGNTRSTKSIPQAPDTRLRAAYERFFTKKK